MSFAQRPRLVLESLDCRLVPTVLDLSSVGSEYVAPSGAIVSQYDDPAPQSINSFVSLKQAGGNPNLPGAGTEQGYNTNARPIQFDESKSAQQNHALKLSDVPIVTVGGVAYRQFLLDINQTTPSPYLSLDEVRVFLGTSGNLSGYNASAKTLAGLAASFDLDSGGDVSVQLNANLNAGTQKPDMVLLIPDAAFAGADGNSFVYLYSKFSGANGGFEEWAVGDVPVSPPPPPPPPPPTGTASLSGNVSVDPDGVHSNGDEVALANVHIVLYDAGFHIVAETTTDSSGNYHFDNLLAGSYTIWEDLDEAGNMPQLADGTNYVGTVNGSENGSTGGDVDMIQQIVLADGNAGVGYDFTERFGE